MVEVNSSVTINRPLPEVVAFVSDMENGPKWTTGVVESEVLSEGVDGVGATARAVRQFPGMRVEVRWEVTAYEPNKLLVVKSTSGPMSMTVRYEFAAVAEHATNVSLVLQAEASGLLKLAEPFMAPQIQKELDGNFRRLKSVLEAQA